MNFYNTELIDNLTIKHEVRLQTEPYLQELINQIEDYKKMREDTEISLNLLQRKKEKEERDKINADREKLYGNLEKGETDEVKLEDSEVKDAYLREGLNIIADWLAYRIG
jgi:hypothetical protein